MTPSALRSSGTMPMPRRMAAAGDHRRSARPSTRTVPASTGCAPNTAFAVSVRPEPSRPARPTTSPACTSRLTPASCGPAGEPGRLAAPGRRWRAWCSAPKLVAPCARTSAMSRPSIVATSRSRVGLGDRSAVDEPTVAQHGHPLADPEDLVELVGHVQDRDVADGAVVDDADQQVDLARLQRRRRLVHDDDPGVGGQRPGDRDHLLHAEAELAEPPAHVHVDAVPGQRRARLPLHPGEVDEADPVAGLAAQEQVVRHAERAAPG